MIGKINTKGFNINGIIEQYTAGSSNVNAGDFVSFVNGLAERTATQLYSGSDDSYLSAYSGIYLQYSTIAVVLSSDKVLIIWGYNSSYHYLRGVVCTIRGTTITKGTITSLSSVANSGYGFMSAVALNDNDVFIAHDYDSSNYYLYGLVCRISGTTISVGTDTYLSTKGYIASATLLSPNKVFVAHRGDNNYLYGLVCLVNNMTISPGTDTLLRNISTFGISPVTLNNNYVFIAHCPSDIGNLYYTTCAIDNTTITTTTIAKQSDYSYFYGLSVVRYTDNNMIVIYANSKLYGRLVGGYTIASTTSVDQDILGVAKTNAVAGATVDVYVPNI